MVHNQVGREVKAPDLRSGSQLRSWVRTPHLVLFITLIYWI